jgi:hypothetical protein
MRRRKIQENSHFLPNLRRAASRRAAGEHHARAPTENHPVPRTLRARHGVPVRLLRTVVFIAAEKASPAPDPLR